MGKRMDKEVITPRDFYTEMVRIAFTENQEMGHILADELMCSILTQLGYGDGVKLFEEMEKWYS